jgi:hypothetical protein
LNGANRVTYIMHLPEAETLSASNLAEPARTMIADGVEMKQAQRGLRPSEVGMSLTLKRGQFEPNLPIFIRLQISNS